MVSGASDALRFQSQSFLRSESLHPVGDTEKRQWIFASAELFHHSETHFVDGDRIYLEVDQNSNLNLENSTFITGE